MIERIPILWLAVAAAWLAVAPVWPEPHLIEKVRMLLAGALVKPIDIFDLVLHVGPLVLLAYRLWLLVQRRRAAVPDRDASPES